MYEAGMNHALRVSRSTAQTSQVLQVAPMHFGTGGGKGFGCRIRAGQAEHLVARDDQFFYDGRADESGRSG